MPVPAGGVLGIIRQVFSTVPANLAGIPGLSVPCGFVRGLPVGLQLLGQAFDESTLFRIGQAFQGATEHHRARPPLS